MIKKIAWETFKNTGDINAYLELKQIENFERITDNNMTQIEEKYIEIGENKKRG